MSAPSYADTLEMLLEAIDCLGTSEEGISREYELAAQFQALIGKYDDPNRAENLAQLFTSAANVELGIERTSAKEKFDRLLRLHQQTNFALLMHSKKCELGQQLLALPPTPRAQAKLNAIQLILDVRTEENDTAEQVLTAARELHISFESSS
jgi:hypothetical protein